MNYSLQCTCEKAEVEEQQENKEDTNKRFINFFHTYCKKEQEGVYTVAKIVIYIQVKSIFFYNNRKLDESERCEEKK